MLAKFWKLTTRSIRSVRSQRTVAALTMLLAISACVPFIGQYYHVSATAGRAVGSGRGNLTGPPDAWEFYRGDVRFVAGPVTRGIRAGKYFFLEMWIPPNDEVNVNFPQMKIFQQSPQNNLSTGLPVGYVLGDKGFIPLKSLQLLRGNEFVNPVFKTSVFLIEFKFDDPMPLKFDFQFPDININGRSYSAMIISYEKRSGVWSTPVND